MKFLHTIFFTVLVQCRSGDLFEMASEVALGGKAEVGGDLNIGIIGVDKQVLCQFDLFPDNEFTDGNPLIFFEDTGKIVSVYMNFISNFRYQDLVMQMRKNVVFTKADIAVDLFFVMNIFTVLLDLIYQKAVLVFCLFAEAYAVSGSVHSSILQI